ncbi:GIY-YIG nuclease family protein [Mucilaginibacter terrigena]|uniref:GIY-YIG nuclease family protein n=1 Tax=Mucilaginibacter terrigena TaxID=2492395 RepID=A0A4Q5LLS2_9SPHI|nr:GIY-YIG nuclease family protein [Mucilaginibacter terrigena]RYU90608.1 GIY-YIG nuclease family protein [Mucilaginibacter terrigena]
MKIHQYYVYIITNASNNVLYTGVTNDLADRVLQHKDKMNKGFSAQYQCGKLVYYEEFQWIQDAIAREKQIKAGSRKKKIALIVNENPDCNDLSIGWYD